MDSGLSSYSFLIPMVRNSDQQPQDRNLFRELEDALAANFGGWTKRLGVYGAWVNEAGETIKDVSVEYEIHVKQHEIFALGNIVLGCLVTFDQEEIRIVKGGIVWPIHV